MNINKSNPKHMSLEFDFKKRRGSIIKVIGVGGGGGNAVANMVKNGIQGVDFVVCNTDIQALDMSPVDLKIQLGPHLTEGRGAGSKPDVGREACLESIDDIKEFLDDGTKMLFVTAGMGGGTGTGAAPIVAKAAKEMGILTVAIVTLPFQFEGMRRQRYAIEGLEELKQNVDAYLVISNDRVSKIHGGLGLSEAFEEADSIVTTAAKGIAEIITVPGYINVDFEDVNTVMRKTGVSIMGSSTAEGEDRARRAIDGAMNSPLLEENDIRGAQHILLNLTSGKKEVTMDEVREITDYVQEEAGYGTNIIWGNCRDETLGDKLSVTLIATGFKSQHGVKPREEVKKVRIALDESSELSESNGVVIGFDEGFEANTIDFEEDDVKKTIETLNSPAYSDFNSMPEPEPEPETSPVNEKIDLEDDDRYRRMEDARRTYMRKSLSSTIDNPRSVSELESEPAYKRRNVKLDNVKNAEGKASASRLAIGEDIDNPLKHSNNSFLHENVD